MRSGIVVALAGLAALCSSTGCEQRERRAAREAARETLPGVGEPGEERAVPGREEVERGVREMDERQPVAGREPMVPLETALREHFGAGWMVTRVENGYLATRATPATAPVDLQKKVDQEIRSTRSQEKGLDATFSGQQLVLKGTSESCANLAREAKDFAAIEGVNRILVSATCPR